MRLKELQREAKRVHGEIFVFHYVRILDNQKFHNVYVIGEGNL